MLAVLFAGAICAMLSIPALAENHLKGIDIEVTLRPDGSAYLTQVWNGSFDEGTECYFPVGNLGERTLTGLTVSDEGDAFCTLPQWDTSASFEEKARSCGLNPIDDGYEVCWGIGAYGDRRFAVEYQLSGLVSSYDDYDGLLFQFVPSGMSTGPTDVTLRLVTQDGTPLSEETAAIWAFGFDGEAGFTEDGEALAYTTAPLEEEQSVILLLRLEKGILSPQATVSGSFAELQDRAFEGSDYTDQPINWEFWCMVILCGVFAIGIFLWVCGAEGRRIDKLYKAANYWRDPPVGGNLEAGFVLAERFHLTNDDEALIAATLMKLLAEGCLEPLTALDVGLLGREKQSVSLRLVSQPRFPGPTARKLYALLTEAAGVDGVLQEYELESYCKAHYQAMLEIVQHARQDGAETLSAIGCYLPSGNTDALSGLTERGNALLLELMGYKKYLNDFSLIAERGVKEALVWQNCLIYAALYGIADKVMKELRRLFPDVETQLQTAEVSRYVAYRYSYATYQAAKNAELSAQRAAGGGGHASLGGGGGYSGGGHGGGTR